MIGIFPEGYYYGGVAFRPRGLKRGYVAVISNGSRQHYSRKMFSDPYEAALWGIRLAARVRGWQA